MKKTLIALAVAGFSFNAAAVNLTDGTGVAKFASEIVPTSNILGATGNNAASVEVLNVSGKLGLGTDVTGAATAGTKVFVRFDFDNARLVDNLVQDANTGLTVTATPAITPTIAAGGKATDSFVVFEVLVADGETLAKDAAFEFAYDRLALIARGDINVTKRVYSEGDETIAESATPAADGILSAKQTGTVATFADGLNIDATQKTQLISLNDGGLKFKGANGDITTATLGNLIATANAGVLDVTGATFGLDDVFDLANSSIVVEGDFSGVADKTDVEIGSVKASELDIANGKATFSGLTDTTADGKALSFVVDGVSQLAESGYKASLALAPKTGITGIYSVPASAEVELGNTEFEGASADFNLVLSDKSSFTQFLRVTNEGTVPATEVAFHVYDTAGNTAVVEQADIPALGASQPVDVKSIYAAAADKNADLGNESLLRIKVRAKAQSGSLEASSYTLSKDVNSVQNLY